MKKPSFHILFIILLILQVLLMQFFTFSRFVMINFLPVMILCIPIDKGNIFAMIVAFVTGLVVDFIGDGMLGLTSLALVPTALSRLFILRIVFGSEIIARGDNISVRKQGVPKMLLASFITCSLFNIIYISIDAAGTMAPWLLIIRLLCTSVASTLVSFFVADLLTSDNKWK